jgi:hypothetical protein
MLSLAGPLRQYPNSLTHYTIKDQEASSLSGARKNILERIILRGGIFGATAAEHATDEINGNLFIKECFEQCHNRGLWDYWGKELVLDLILYRLHFLRVQCEEAGIGIPGRRLPRRIS